MRMVSSVNWPHVVNLGNSIIGVSILTMPFCFQQCGIILGTILLLFCTWLTLVSCQLLMKAGITSRRKSYEFLAYHTLGGGGKFAIEFLLIGLQLGTMIAQIVVIGDLGPSIVSKFTGFENTNKLRSGLILILCLFVGLPLGLLKNVRSLSSASTMCVCFYAVFVFSMIIHSFPNLWLGNWVMKVRFWRTEGLFQCIPIFSLAFGCQTQLFILYDDLPEPSFKVINKIVSNAVNICSVAYLLVGFFGYIAFCSTEITGDIINMLAPSLITDFIKLAFVLSIAVTFPLIIFPCRTSLYTMLFPRRPKTSDGFEMSHQIPELHFKLMTIAIVVISMVIGMSVPNVEFILGLNGATMGTLICYIMPALFFLKVMSVTSEGKTLAKLVLVMGILVLLISTYTTLNFQDKSHHAEHQEEKRLKDNIAAKEAVQDIIAAKQPPVVVDHNIPIDNGRNNHEGDAGDGQDKTKEKDAHRHEPPVPKPPDELPDVDQSNEKIKLAEANKKSSAKKKDTIEDVKAERNAVHGEEQAAAAAKDAVKKIGTEKGKGPKDNDNLKKKQAEGEKKQEELLHKLEEQQQEQKKILEEQRELLKELKKHREEEHQEKMIENQKPNNAQQAAKNPQAYIVQKENSLQKQEINQQQAVNNNINQGFIQQEPQAVGNMVNRNKIEANIVHKVNPQLAANNNIKQGFIQQEPQAVGNMVNRNKIEANIVHKVNPQLAANNNIKQGFIQQEPQAVGNMVNRNKIEANIVQKVNPQLAANNNIKQGFIQQKPQAVGNMVNRNNIEANIVQKVNQPVQQNILPNIVQNVNQPVHALVDNKIVQNVNQPNAPVDNIVQQRNARSLNAAANGVDSNFEEKQPAKIQEHAHLLQKRDTGNVKEKALSPGAFKVEQQPPPQLAAQLVNKLPDHQQGRHLMLEKHQSAPIENSPLQKEPSKEDHSVRRKRDTSAQMEANPVDKGRADSIQNGLGPHNDMPKQVGLEPQNRDPLKKESPRQKNVAPRQNEVPEQSDFQQSKVLVNMKRQKNVFTEDAAMMPQNLAGIPQVDEIEKKHFPQIAIRSLKSAKENKVV